MFYFLSDPGPIIVYPIPGTGLSSGMAGGADLILNKAWPIGGRLYSAASQWSVHCLGDTNTCDLSTMVYPCQ